jgi:ribosomal protein S18 acetylase RimI-like enzyme
VPAPQIEPFTVEHFAEVLELISDEEWTTLTRDPQATLHSFSAPGVLCLVAMEERRVVGFAQTLSDGVIQAYLCRLLVAKAHRGRGIGRLLVQSAFSSSGAQRLDLLAAEGVEEFYASFPHSDPWPGYRLTF